MTRLGRRPRGPAHVDSLWGSAHAKARLRAFLATLSGELGVDEACRQLGLSSSRFFELRTAWLHGALALLEPRSPGRPRHAEPAVPLEEARALRARISELEARAAAVEAQAELARTLPHVVARATPKKTSRPAVARRPRSPR